MNYRHENKYIISNKQAFLLMRRLLNILELDCHNNGSYRIKSLYLDDINEKLLRNSIDGIEYRKKYRIRYYNNDYSLIKLERKITRKNLKNKKSIQVSKQNVLEYIEKKSMPICNELVYEVSANWLMPKVIIEYDRIAFVSNIGNVRITFDSNIIASEEISKLFDDDLLGMPVLPLNRTILEIKYDKILPGYISKIINSIDLQRCSYSKYVMSMNILKNNGRLENIYEI